MGRSNPARGQDRLGAVWLLLAEGFHLLEMSFMEADLLHDEVQRSCVITDFPIVVY